MIAAKAYRGLIFTGQQDSLIAAGLASIGATLGPPTLVPTEGDDLVTGFPFPTPATLNGLGGFDILDMSAATNAVTASLSTTGATTVRVAGVTAGLSIRSFEGLIGSAFADRLTGSSAGDHFAGNAGDDTINGNGGNDTIPGGAGDDSLSGGKGSDVLVGDAGNDSVSGGAGSDSLVGGDGDDTLRGDGGVDTTTGGAGNDSYRVDDPDGLIVEDAGEGIDSVQAIVSYTLAGNVENLTLTGTAGIDGGGNALANVIGGNGGNNYIFGADGNDTIRGIGGDDNLDGDLGDDVIDGGVGNDYLFGGSGSGSDTLIAGTGDDSADGGAGNDSLRGDAGADLPLGGDGNDTIDGGAGDDILFGQAGADIFLYRVTDGADRINDFEIGVDKVRVLNSGINSFSQLQALFVQNGADSAIEFSATAKITLQGVDFRLLSANDFIFG